MDQSFAASASARTLIAGAISRCRGSGNVARTIVTLSCLDTSTATERSTFRFTVADTGPGIHAEELQDLCFKVTNTVTMAIEGTMFWDGVLSITTSDSHEKKSRSYQIKFRHNSHPQILELRPQLKTNALSRKSGTEASMHVEGPTRETISHFQDLLEKTSILNIKGLSLELQLENCQGHGSSCHGNARIIGLSELDELEAGTLDYISKCLCRSGVERATDSRSLTKLGKGQSGSKTAGWSLQACVALTEQISPCGQMPLETKVLYFEDLCYTSTPLSVLHSLWKNVDWLKFGLPVRDVRMDTSDTGIIQWEFSKAERIDVVLHWRKTHSKKSNLRAEAKMIKEAVEGALHDLKMKIPDLLTSPHAKKMQSCVPELSRCIAGLIKSSTDTAFQAECGEIIGLLPTEIDKLESCISYRLGSTIQAMDASPQANIDKDEEQNLPHSMSGGGSDNDMDYEEITFED